MRKMKEKVFDGTRKKRGKLASYSERLSIESALPILAFQEMSFLGFINITASLNTYDMW